MTIPNVKSQDETVKLPPYALRLKDAYLFSGIGRSSFLNAVYRGDLPKGRTIGKCRYWLVEELQAALREVPQTPPGTSRFAAT